MVVEGAAPAPLPITKPLAVKTPDDAQVDALEKYGIPPEVPATVRARVPLLVIGDPDTEIRPPVKLCATEVTVPLPLLLKVLQSVDDKYPLTDEVACGIEIAGVLPPLETIGDVPVTDVTVPWY